MSSFLSALEECVFAARSIVSHAGDCSRQLSGVQTNTLPVREPRYRLISQSALSQICKAAQAHRNRHTGLILAEANLHLIHLEERHQDLDERMSYSLYQIKQRSKSCQKKIDERYRMDIANLEDALKSKKGLWNKVCDRIHQKEVGVDAMPAQDCTVAIDCTRQLISEAQQRLDEIKELNFCNPLEYDRLLEQVAHLKQTLATLDEAEGMQNIDTIADPEEQLRSEILQLEQSLEKQAVHQKNDRERHLKQICALTRAFASSSQTAGNAIRILKRVFQTNDNLICPIEEIESDFPKASPSAQEALQSALDELISLGFMSRTGNTICIGS